MSKNNPQTQEEKEAKFLAEMTKLTKKYGVAIGGCGCCDSPYLYNPTNLEGKYTNNGGYVSFD